MKPNDVSIKNTQRSNLGVVAAVCGIGERCREGEALYRDMKQAGVSRIVAETRTGSFGLLPHRLDCVAAPVPGILIYETTAEGEDYVAVDEGVLVKTGLDVLVATCSSNNDAEIGRIMA